uniref:Protopolybiakinin-2 n=1 Tax=Protopolybia exigua TaxID=91439 RepID=BRK2_PROEX|nr:RecName: Full=Protopolybiakinin-2; AltName: Full=Bradykinin-related peptide; AltName: Full=Protopolybiakinin-II [Protopolybia exigua]
DKNKKPIWMAGFPGFTPIR